jgi:hypothetical protein
MIVFETARPPAAAALPCKNARREKDRFMAKASKFDFTAAD